jgi:hypothetical protein
MSLRRVERGIPSLAAAPEMEPVLLIQRQAFEMMFMRVRYGSVWLYAQ